MKKRSLLPLAALITLASAAEPAASFAEVTPDTPALLCADQSDNRIRLIDPTDPVGRKRDLWCYPADPEASFPHMPTDAKRVVWKDEVHILAAYHGRVQLIRFHDQKVIKDHPSLSSCHSAELLPDGSLVSANSNHGILRWHRSDDQFLDLKLPYAHGVAWDKNRQCLWALGDLLYRIEKDGDKLVVRKKFSLPLDPTGHDLFPLRDGSKLLVSNNPALFLFDLKTETFETVAKIPEIKSASQHADLSLWITDPEPLAGAASWQTDSVVSLAPKGPEKRHRNQGSKFYKARWWQQVDFSY